ncbi:PF14257 domain protein [Leptospira weilii str. 2006001853]|uniref:PF14257 domain protein n=1 Tax=Leptospira weilii str. 2006001853 TaxID=1001589 RepID=A0A828YZU4_9LEPT|nr:PF14257 domain protein [Leptospira weilii str. 2006001853]
MFYPSRLILLIVLFLIQCSANDHANTVEDQNNSNVISERKISYTAYVTLNVSDLDESRNKIKLLIRNYKGFITRSNEKTRTS